MTALLGGVFDPPHNGHVAVARAALEQLGEEELIVLVVATPGHKTVTAPAAARLRMARAAFDARARTRVELDDHARTVDLLETGRFADPLLLLGADEWRDFSSWKQPERVLELARVAVATRPGVPIDIPAERRDRVVAFQIEPVRTSSSEVRARVRAGQPIGTLVPAAVATLIDELGLYSSP